MWVDTEMCVLGYQVWVDCEKGVLGYQLWLDIVMCFLGSPVGIPGHVDGFLAPRPAGSQGAVRRSTRTTRYQPSFIYNITDPAEAVFKKMDDWRKMRRLRGRGVRGGSICSIAQRIKTCEPLSKQSDTSQENGTKHLSHFGHVIFPYISHIYHVCAHFENVQLNCVLYCIHVK